MDPLSRSTRRHGRRSFRPTGVGSDTATSSHPFNARFFEELDARLAREKSAAPLTAGPRLVPAPPASFPPASRA